MLTFTDSSDSLGQASASDQILMIQFQPATLTDAGTTLAASKYSTLFNLFDNTTNTYLGGGQHVTKTLADWLTALPVLDHEQLQEVRIGLGLTGGETGAESLTVNSLDLSTPEPASLTLLGAGVIALGFSRRRRAR